MSPRICPRLFGGVLRSAIAPTERARPKIRSDNDSIRGFGGRGAAFSDKKFL